MDLDELPKSLSPEVKLVLPVTEAAEETAVLEEDNKPPTLTLPYVSSEQHFLFSDFGGLRTGPGPGPDSNSNSNSNVDLDLDPNSEQGVESSDRDNWTKQEEAALILAHTQVGSRWSEIALLCKAHTEHANQSRFYFLLSRAKEKVARGDYSFCSRLELLELHYLVPLAESLLKTQPSPQPHSPSHPHLHLHLQLSSCADYDPQIYTIIRDLDPAAVIRYKVQLDIHYPLKAPLQSQLEELASVVLVNREVASSVRAIELPHSDRNESSRTLSSPMADPVENREGRPPTVGTHSHPRILFGLVPLSSSSRAKEGSQPQSWSKSSIHAAPSQTARPEVAESDDLLILKVRLERLQMGKPPRRICSEGSNGIQSQIPGVRHVPPQHTLKLSPLSAEKS